MRPILRPARASARSADWAPGPGVFVLLPVRKSNVRVSKPKTPRARTPSTLALRRGGQNNTQAGLTHWISALAQTASIQPIFAAWASAKGRTTLS